MKYCAESLDRALKKGAHSLKADTGGRGTPNALITGVIYLTAIGVNA
jgi:hypothetical protein